MKKTILLIDDNEDIRESAAELLELEGFNVLTADGGETALVLAQKYLPDLVICDILMPDIDGYQVFDSMKQQLADRKVQFIFSTAKSEQEDQERARMLGVDNYLIKPFNEFELLKMISKCL